MKKLLIIILLVFFISGIGYSQNLMRVNNNPAINADYNNLQDANDNASIGDTIYIEGSETEYEGAKINKMLTIIGPGYLLSDNPKTQANKLEAKFNSDIHFNAGSAGSTIAGCNLSYSGGIYINVDGIQVIRCFFAVVQFDTQATVRNILIHQNYITHGIWSPASSIMANNVVISNNIIDGFVSFPSTSGPIQIANNVFSATPNFSINCYNSTIQNNIFCKENIDPITNKTGNTINNNILAANGTNANGNQYNINMSNVFTAYNDFSPEISTDGKWQLKAGSPAIGAGVNGVDCGVFGGAKPYVLSGLPNLPHIYEASIPATATSGDGLPVTIKVKSGQ